MDNTELEIKRKDIVIVISVAIVVIALAAFAAYKAIIWGLVHISIS